jgi:2-C-methyl-D-erythritol 4-phosphate cytidylyltransferase
LTQSEYALIVAGGRGTRIKSDLPKQFLEVQGKPILLHTIEAFYKYSKDITVILVLPEDQFPIWHQISEKYNCDKTLVLRSGGPSRFQSVKNGLDAIEGKGLVAIHDGVRPLVTPEIISRSFRLAEIHGSAVAAVELKESLRMRDASGKPDAQKNVFKAVDRSQFRIIQTPQTFDIAIIKNAYTMSEDPTLTDDASVAERGGQSILLFEGSYQNIKVTTPEDLLIVAALLQEFKRV